MERLRGRVREGRLEGCIDHPAPVLHVMIYIPRKGYTGSFAIPASALMVLGVGVFFLNPLFFCSSGI